MLLFFFPISFHFKATVAWFYTTMIATRPVIHSGGVFICTLVTLQKRIICLMPSGFSCVQRTSDDHAQRDKLLWCPKQDSH